jgi:hypothetical protein
VRASKFKESPLSGTVLKSVIDLSVAQLYAVELKNSVSIITDAIPKAAPKPYVVIDPIPNPCVIIDILYTPFVLLDGVLTP